MLPGVIIGPAQSSGRDALRGNTDPVLHLPPEVSDEPLQQRKIQHQFHRWAPQVSSLCERAHCWCCVQHRLGSRADAATAGFSVSFSILMLHLHGPGGGVTQRADGVPLDLLSHLPQPAHARSGNSI